VFDQSVYVETLNKSSPNGTTVFTFSVRSELIYTRPSYAASLAIGTNPNVVLGNLTVTSDHSDFTVEINNNGTYRLVTKSS
jgi:hypothetical protein